MCWRRIRVAQAQQTLVVAEGPVVMEMQAAQVALAS
jgi:hypothetical protein